MSDFADLSPLAAWSAHLAPAASPLESVDPNLRVVASAGVLAAHQFGAAPALPGAEACVAAFRLSLRQRPGSLSPNLVVAGAEHVASWLANTGQMATFDALSATLEPYLELGTLDPLIRARWLFWLGTNHMFADQRALAEKNWQRAREAPGAAEWPWLRYHLTRIAARPLIEDGQNEQARLCLAALRGLTDFSRPLDVADYHHLCGWLALGDRDAGMARQHYEQARAAAELARLPEGHAVIYRSGLALGLLMDGREEEAEQITLDSSASAASRMAAAQASTVALIRARRAHRLGQREAYHEQLRQGLGLAREHGLLRFFRLAPGVAAELCADALTAGIEPDFVRRAIAQRRLVPPSRNCASWPWPVRVRCLGGFELRLAGDVCRNAQQRPLDLLRTLIALGPRPCDVATLADALWPDADGDVARASLDITLHRLRKALKCPQAVRVQDSRVELDPAQVWIDAWALESLVAHVDSVLRRPGGPAPSLPVLDRLAAELTDLYRGGFLGSRQPTPLAEQASARWRSQFERATRLLVAAFTKAEEADRAESLLRQALERDASLESLSGELMELMMSRGRHAEALNVFEQCRHSLATATGMSPSPRTIELSKVAAGTLASGLNSKPPKVP